jgi:uncharacterized protein
MKIAVISDIHDNINNLILVLKEIEINNAEYLICLGDLVNNGIARTLASLKIPAFTIWGNNDGSKVGITKTSLAKGSNLTVGFATFDMIELDGRKLFLTHYPMLAKPMAKSNDFDAVFFGHNHIKNIEKINNCLVVNPGEICAERTGICSYAIYDTKTNTAEIFEVKNSISVSTDIVKDYKEKLRLKFQPSPTHQY